MDSQRAAFKLGMEVGSSSARNKKMRFQSRVERRRYKTMERVFQVKGEDRRETLLLFYLRISSSHSPFSTNYFEERNDSIQNSSKMIEISF